jgi:hypothetical protein
MKLMTDVDPKVTQPHARYKSNFKPSIEPVRTSIFTHPSRDHVFQLPSPYATLLRVNCELVSSGMQKPGFMFEFNSFDDRNKANPIVGEWPALPPTRLSVFDDIRLCQPRLSFNEALVKQPSQLSLSPLYCRSRPGDPHSTAKNHQASYKIVM